MRRYRQAGGQPAMPSAANTSAPFAFMALAFFHGFGRLVRGGSSAARIRYRG
jgi:hypothetical protein